MSKFKKNDFLELDFDIYANDKLVQTTDPKKTEGLENTNNFLKKPSNIVLGKGQILMAIDEDIENNAKIAERRKLELSSEKAYGKRKKDLIKTFPKRVFDEQKLRAVPGITYDFNGMYGSVKSVVGGRVMVDFNNPLAGKDIKIEYVINKKIEDLIERIKITFYTIYNMNDEMFSVVKEKEKIIIKVPEQLMALNEQLLKSLEELNPDIKKEKVEFEKLDPPSKK
jgi:FKBP-type peptidyl-prolyl cis-trans isomerase 2